MNTCNAVTDRRCPTLGYCSTSYIATASEGVGAWKGQGRHWTTEVRLGPFSPAPGASLGD